MVWMRWAIVAGALAVALNVVAQEQTGLTVPKHGVGTAVVDRELEGRGESFPEGTKVWFWTKVVGGQDGDRIRHVWSHEGQEMLRIGLSIGGSHWRTYSNKTLHAGLTGAWSVEAWDDQDRVLARQTFECTPR